MSILTWLAGALALVLALWLVHALLHAEDI